MRQNFVSDNIVSLSSNVLGDESFLSSVNAGSLNRVAQVLRGSNRSALSFIVDIDDDSLLSFDFMLGSQSVSASSDLVIGVFTFIGNDVPSGGSLVASSASAYSGYFYPIGSIGDRCVVSGRCIVPSLSKSENQVQWVSIGYCSADNSPVASSSISMQARIHTEDVTVFDPLRQ